MQTAAPSRKPLLLSKFVSFWEGTASRITTPFLGVPALAYRDSFCISGHDNGYNTANRHQHRTDSNDDLLHSFSFQIHSTRLKFLSYLRFQKIPRAFFNLKTITTIATSSVTAPAMPIQSFMFSPPVFYQR